MGQTNFLSKDRLSKLYLKISPLLPYENTDTHTEFLLLIRPAGIPENVERINPIKMHYPLLIGIGTCEIPSDVPFLIFDIFPIQIEVNHVPTKEISLPFELNSKDIG